MPPSAVATHAPSILHTWVFTPVVSALMIVATILYCYGVFRARRAGSPWPWTRVLSWFIAMALIVFSVNTVMADLAKHLFWAHMVVHLNLITVVPLFLVLAQPIRLLATATGEKGDRRVRAVLSNPVMRIFASPIVGLPLYAAVLIGTHLTGFQDLALENPWLRNAEYTVYLFAGWLFMLPLVGNELCGPTKLSHPLRFASFLLAMGPDTLVGVTLMMTSTELAPEYALSRAGWGPSGLVDQSAAGAIMWFGGDGLMMLLLLIVAFQWITAEATGKRGGGMGSWLDSARRGTLIGDGADDSEVDVDDDEAALAAYNARLRQLNQRQG
ncbi:Cytochrome c oxidase caa3-type, assembly factor CtaG-related protein OS=Tsukamurella paurometabola(strain ATCC 8368 / DSM / CCUG 35730 / CIP 100753 / JCM 10117 / KCTC 9821 / NBRC 16120 / NCIMB 702349 / NCTC 13040)OX=521096 GN=Tpau_2485 PE=4 SV=1 [Tsukamurella paurometabola]|uniref:Cytochrome c oxidase caa3-type, assembly factor CtaG-related protein n=1 Tax=Tsukamurella paurometabola (strain ATCC 8368 / DSM 20162 / CCUG 35730 / CIP 100753 / JCM 10117 / KCTC 9821 / NBRC 16120 / NCIMB 702349 / NCTC 13040) TaxID=521096 RepID=D5URN4_TSUPD|nr:cytochrome c oxidase assembly protein [Tsukamurella paurometabola]ADG79089.1 Cytochrome c oxidase caa3-type, assembly factor CtaG-related protein [Tsukamurella paurometabola DSM 20162]SUP34039.1 Cytochrome c oxidase caa3 assembly factor (Caa3_CtaG) [Tsukamurella paurometabola]